MAKPFWEKMQAIDRRIIFLFVAAGVIIPLIVTLDMGVRVTEIVKGIHKKVEDLEPGSPILIAADFDPSAKEELYPMLEAVLYHCFKKNHRVVAVTLWPGAAGLIKQALKDQAKEFNKVNGEDYVFLGFKTGGPAVVLSMGQDLKNTFPEIDNKPSAQIPVLNDINRLADFSYVIAISAGAPGIDEWIIYGSEKYGFKLGGGCTGVMATQYFPYLNAKQINGLMGGLKGAAEYEDLVKRPSTAMKSMDAQAVTHLVIIAFIILGNIAYFSTRKTKKS
jgi:hypothetical protein